MPVGITVKMGEREKRAILDKAGEVKRLLVEGGIRAELDLRDHVSPGRFTWL